MSARPAVATAEWRIWCYKHETFTRCGCYPDTDPEQLRASVSDKRVTVWLPLGKRVVFRRMVRLGSAELITKPFTRKHLYGSHARGSRTAIVVTIKPEDVGKEIASA